MKSDAVAAILGTAALGLALSACSGTTAAGQDAPDHAGGNATETTEAVAPSDEAGPTPTETPEETPEPTPEPVAPDAIRRVDPASLNWLRWTGFVGGPVPIDPTQPDEYGRIITVGDPVYSDASGDGLEDMIVPLSVVDGNGFEEHWYLWLADPDGGQPVQIPLPVSAGSRCGDWVESVVPVDGGFEVHEFLRHALLDDHLDCASTGTFEVTRRVAAAEDLGEPILVDADDPRGYGGFCPSHQYTHPYYSELWGSPNPRLDGSLSIDGEEWAYYPTDYHSMTDGNDPLRLYAAWAEPGSDNRICVWVNPGRWES